MSMVVRTNTMAINANSALNKNNSTVAGNLAKLSSGFRINRAADDASGLAVSEKMKAQIKALDQANKNAQDGASLIKTAEGYMGEIHDMLNRIVELAEKSANGTYEVGGTNATTGEANTAATETYGNAGTDRQAIQDEVDQLTTEIDRIAKTANFNQLKLLDGSLEVKDIPAQAAKTTYTPATTQPKYSVSNEIGASTDLTSVTTVYNAQGEAFTIAADPGSDTTKITADSAKAGGYFTTRTDPSMTNLYEVDNAEAGTYKAATAFDPGKTYYTKTDIPATPARTEGTGLKLQIGETSEAADKLEVSIKSFKTADLFADLATDELTANNTSAAAKTAGFVAEKDGDYQGLTLNVSNQETASKVAEKVRDVINSVSSQRATLGAMENRLDYTMNNLDTASQNITDANSRIRDTDMAKTMMQYTQGNTLTQAAQAMLAQANQAPSQVLQLLQ